MDDNSEIRYLGDVQRLDLRPNDVLVITVDDDLSMTVIERLKIVVGDALPNHKNKMLILTGKVKIGVLAQ